MAEQGSHQGGAEHASHRSLHGFLRAEHRRQLMPSEGHSGQIRAGIADPGADKDQPHHIDPSRKLSGQPEEGKQDRAVKEAEKRGHHLPGLMGGKGEHIGFKYNTIETGLPLNLA